MSYFLLSALPMRLVFKFRKDRRRPVPGQPITGTVTVIIHLKLFNEEKAFGPYATGFRATSPAWDRRMHPTRADNERLKQELESYSKNIEMARGIMLKQERPITARLLHEVTLKMIPFSNEIDAMRKAQADSERIRQVMADADQTLIEYLDGKAPSCIRTLESVYTEFLVLKESLKENDQYKRAERQDLVSESTIKGYKRDWVVLYRYLVASRQQQVLISRVSRNLAMSLNQFLSAQRMPDGSRRYSGASIRNTIGLLKQLCFYAVDKEYIPVCKLARFSIRVESEAEPRPLSVEMLDYLTRVELPNPLWRWMLDSWLVAAELCMHYCDFRNLPKMEIRTFENGVRYIPPYSRQKQRGKRLKLTVDITPRAEAIIAKWGGIDRLCYYSLTYYCMRFGEICRYLDLRDADGKPLRIRFGDGRDSGLTNRVIAGASPYLIMNIAAHSNLSMQSKYVKAPVELLEQFVGKD